MSSAKERGTSRPLNSGKRRITGARKEQNRIAQQVYRQRQKRRILLRNIPSHGSLPRHHHLQPRQSLSRPSYSGDDLLLHMVEQSQLDILELPSDINEVEPNGSGFFSSSSFDLQGFPTDLNFNGEGTLFVPVLPSHFSPDNESNVPHNPTSYLEFLPENLAPAPNLVENSSSGSHNFNADFTSLKWNISQPNTSKTEVSMDSTLIKRYYPQQKLPMQPYNSLEGIQNPSNDPTDQEPSEMQGIEALVSALSNFINSGQFRPGSQQFHLPDPHSNNLYSVQTSTLLPYLHNARCIGLDIQGLLAMKSPFYNPNRTIADDPTTLLLEARKPWIPAHLQPTLPQVLFPHHPYLDLLPFPALRERAITFTAMFNAIDLKLDIFREGLCCSPRSQNNEYLGNNQPWDMRSWEVKPWFWKKWRLLMDSSATASEKAMGGLDDSGRFIGVI